MDKNELDNIVCQLKLNKKPVKMTKREFVNAFGCEKRTSGNTFIIDNYLNDNSIITVPSYIDGWIDEEMELRFKYNIKHSNFQLYYIEVHGYKNLDIAVDLYDTDNYCCFIGLNGSGKSNVLEAVSNIFYSLYHIATLKDGYKKYSCNFQYTIRYINNGIYYEITDGKLTNGGKITETILPKNVIASYSGEDTRLWKDFYKPIYEKYCSKMVATAGFRPPFLFYLSRYEWEISLLTLLYSEDVDVVKFIDELIGNLECKISFDYKSTNIKKWEGTEIEGFIDELQKEKEYNVTTFRNKINSISFIDQASTLYYCLYKCRTESDNQIISKINITFNGRGTVDGLSEGEKKLVNANAVIHILSTKDSLCLFDEPDAHIHIANQIKLKELINNNNRYSLVTTHSPVFLDLVSDDKNVRYMNNGHIELTDKLKQIQSLSGGTINYFEGAFILSAKNILVTEGKYDGKYLKKAADVLSKKDEKYRKLNFGKDISVIQVGGASNAVELYSDVLKPLLSQIDKLVFLFDYDDAVKSGWKKIYDNKDVNGKVIPMFYQHDYSITLDTTQNPKVSDRILVEDLFSEESYTPIVQIITGCKSHKDFRNITLPNGQKRTADAIKEYIENNYQKFKDSWFDGFKPLLDKLLELYGL